MSFLRPTRRAQLLSLPAMPDAIYAIGDIHGRADLLRDIEQRIAADFTGRQSGLIVTLGDAVDRGNASAQVMDILTTPFENGLTRLCLRGNHEQMMIDFCASPRLSHPWLRNGGAATLRSYGVDLDRGHLRAQIQTCIPRNHLDFLAHLPLALSVGAFRFCHAAMNPDLPFSEQSPRDLMWGNPGIWDAGRNDATLIHGHRAIADHDAPKQRISLDTQADRTSVLRCLRLTPDGGVAMTQAHAHTTGFRPIDPGKAQHDDR